jgi:MYXO-CTERM domain-containing protein
MLLSHRGGFMRVLSLLAIFAAVPASVQAFCGFYVAGADTQLFNNATMVVLMRDGTRTVLSMRNDYQGPPEDFALVIPVPVVLQEENVKTLDAAVFDTVDRLAAPRLVEYWEQDPCEEARRRVERAAYDMLEAPMASAEGGSGGRGQVVIEAQFEVGEYEIVILSASDSTALDTWLRDNHYSIPDGAAEVLRPYVEGGMKFFVAKVDVEKVRFTNSHATLSPLRFHYDSQDFSLPVRLGLLNSRGTQDLIVHVLALDQRYEVANYENVTIPTNIDVAETARTRFGEFYAALFDRTIERNPGAIVTEYAWQATNCDPCPGPVLSESDLTTLGADVLPSMPQGAAREMTAESVTVTDAAQNAFAALAIESLKRPLAACVSTRQGSSAVLVRMGADGRPAGPAEVEGLSGTELECMRATLARLRLPPTDAPQEVRATLRWSTDADPWALQSAMQRFVLTRLHARYSRETLSNDLVFRPAPPIVGGREAPGPDGRLETGARPDSVNNFQGRYAMRHPWTGAMDCDAPIRGVWGGPPSGGRNDVMPAQNTAFAPRGEIRLPEVARSNIPEIEITASDRNPSFRVGGEVVEEGSAASSSGSGSGTERSGCGCSSAPSFGGLASLALAALVLVRKRRR